VSSLLTAPADTGTPRSRDDDVAGVVTIDHTVVEKIAARAVLEVPDAAGTARRILGQALPAADRLRSGHSSADALPRASAEVDGSRTYLDLSISVRWPASLAEVTGRVRDHVSARVHELTGLHAVEVHITVQELITDRAPRARVH
jgi:uncharacterized alkaline shock family protein YloU